MRNEHFELNAQKRGFYTATTRTLLAAEFIAPQSRDPKYEEKKFIKSIRCLSLGIYCTSTIYITDIRPANVAARREFEVPRDLRRLEIISKL